MLGGGFGTGLCFAEGGLRSRAGARECGSSSASSQHRSVYSSYFYPQGQQLYLYRMPQELKAFGATSVLQKNTIWMSFILPTFSTPYSPSLGPFCHLLSPSLFMPHYLHRADAELVSCPWWGGWNPMAPKVSSYPSLSEIL